MTVCPSSLRVSTKLRARIACVGALVFCVLAGPPSALAQAPHALQWADCGDGFECATATVPLDYARPKAGTLDIAVTRMPATEPDKRLGSLFVNFGGPGAPAVETLHTPGVIAAFASLNERYDIVGVDPRGTSGTDAIDCRYTTPEQPFPRPATVDRAALIARYRSYIDQCLALNPRVLPYVSTANVARDMNNVRRALGERELNYLGYSYGTVLGATFESMFPQRVGRFVLDGAVDATWLNDPMRFNREQLRSSEMALDRFFEACAANQEACSGFGAENPEATFDDLVERLNATPITAGAGDPRTVNGDDVLAVTSWTMYAKQFWPTLGEALALAAAGDGSLMRELADIFSGRREDGSGSPLFDRTFAIQSLERNFPRTLGLYLRIGAEDYELFDHFWWLGGYSGLGQALWPVRPNDVYRGPFRAPALAPTTLVVGTTYDPVTPYKGAQRLTRKLGNARLLTMHGDGHGAYGENSPCINSAVDAYLKDGIVPAAGTVCQQDVPFQRQPPAAATTRHGTRALLQRLHPPMLANTAAG